MLMFKDLPHLRGLVMIMALSSLSMMSLINIDLSTNKSASITTFLPEISTKIKEIVGTN